MAIVPNQEFYEEATVCVWRNINMFKFIPTGHFGHAAVMLRGPSLGGNDRYISWWPGEGADKKDALRQQRGGASDEYELDMISELGRGAQSALQTGQYQPRANQVETEYENAKQKTLWGVHADAQVSVPGLNVADGEFGLHLPKMWQWYTTYQANNGNYQLASKTQSCSGVAAVSLIEGGGEAFADAPGAMIYMEPTQVEDYANKLRQVITDFNRRFAIFEIRVGTDIQNEIQRQRILGVTIAAATDLWNYDTWMQQSNVKGKMRSSVIGKIDSALKEYHKLLWGNDFKKKYKQLVKILDNVMKHRLEKPDSDRGFAVMRLGKQAVDVFRGRKIQ